MDKGFQILFGVIVVLIVVLGVTLAFWPDGQEPIQKVTGKAVGVQKAEKQPAEIKIGTIAPLTGDASTIGQNVLKVLQLAVDEINSEGGINGAKLKLIAEDGKCNGKDASTATNKLVNVDRVSAIVGGFCSSETLAAAPITEAAEVLTLTPCSSSPAVTNAGDYIFRDYPSDSYAGAYAARFAKSELRVKDAAILYCMSDWCVGLREKFKEVFTAEGGKIVADEAYEQTAKDLRSQLTKIKAADPDMVYFVGYTEASVIGLKQARELGLDVKMVGGDAWDDPKIWTEAGAAGDGAMYPIAASDLSESFKSKVSSATGSEEVTVCVPQAYDAVKILAGVMRQVGTDSTAMKDALYAVGYDGVSGRIEFDQNGDLKDASYDIKVVKDGKTSVMQ